MITNINHEKRIVLYNNERTNDPELYQQALDEGIEEVQCESYGIYS